MNTQLKLIETFEEVVYFLTNKLLNFNYFISKSYKKVRNLQLKHFNYISSILDH